MAKVQCFLGFPRSRVGVRPLRRCPGCWEERSKASERLSVLMAYLGLLPASPFFTYKVVVLWNSLGKASLSIFRLLD